MDFKPPVPVETNPEVKPAKVLERTGARAAILFVGGFIVERALHALSGVNAEWAPYVIGVVKVVWDIYRGPPSYRASDPSAPDTVIRP